MTTGAQTDATSEPFPAGLPTDAASGPFPAGLPITSAGVMSLPGPGSPCSTVRHLLQVPTHSDGNVQGLLRLTMCTPRDVACKAPFGVATSHSHISLSFARAVRASAAPHWRCSAEIGPGPATAMDAPRFEGSEASESTCESTCDWDWDWECDRVPWRRRLGGIWAAWVAHCQQTNFPLARSFMTSFRSPCGVT